MLHGCMTHNIRVSRLVCPFRQLHIFVFDKLPEGTLYAMLHDTQKNHSVFESD